MSEDHLLRAREIIREYDHSNAAVVELAELASLAVRIEPELLRALRLRLAPHLDVGTEGDLWFSSLVQARGADGIMFSAEVAEVFQSRLREDRQRLERAWSVTRDCHQEISPALQLEEEVTFHALSGADQAVIEKTLAPALIALTREGRTGLASWAARALPRLPAEARATSSAWLLSFAASRNRRDPILIGDEAPVDLMQEDLSMVLADVGEVDLGVRLQGDELELGEVRGAGTVKIRVSETVPRLVEVRWQSEGKEQRKVACISLGAAVRLLVGLGPVHLRALSGAVYGLRSVSLQEPENEAGSFIGEAIGLARFQPIEEELGGGQGHRYELSLEAGEFARLVVEKKGIDVVVSFVRPDGARTTVNGLGGHFGPEIAYVIAEEPGPYRVEVVSEERTARPGRYEIRLDQSRMATPEDRVRLEAWKIFLSAENRRRLGEFGAALEEHQRSLRLWNNLNELVWTAWTRSRIGWILHVQGRLDEALSEIQEALTLWSRIGSSPAGRIETLRQAANVLESLGRFDEAHAYLEEAFTWNRKVGDLESEVVILHGLGRVYLNTGKFEQSRLAYEAALKAARGAQSPQSEALSLLNLGRVHEATGNSGHALTEYRAAHKIFQVLGDRANELLSFLFMARTLHRLRRYQEALEHLDRISPHVDALQNQSVYYELHIDVLMRMHETKRDSGYDVAALEIHERSRVHRFLKMSQQVRAREESRPLPYSGVQSLLPADETLLLIYALGEERSYLWCVGREGRVSRVLPARAGIEDIAAQVMTNWIRHGKHSERGARQLSEDLLGPVAHQLGYRRLVIVGDGLLQGFPFGALPDPNSPKEPLLVRHEIVYLPSASILADLRKKLHARKPAFQDIAIIADPVFSSDDPRIGPGIVMEDLERGSSDEGAFERLVFTSEEARRVGEHFPLEASTLLLGFEATREQFLALRDHRILHFATYGAFTQEAPEVSGVALSSWGSDGKPLAGFLSADEICGLDLTTELVVLSACQAGLGERSPGKAVTKLVGGFILAGVPRVVMSLWTVNDRAAAEFMDRFYKAIIDYRLSPSEALRAAQLSMLRGRYSHPFFWAGFIFHGEWNLEVSDPSSEDHREIERTSIGGGFPDDDLPPPGLGERSQAKIPYLGD